MKTGLRWPSETRKGHAAKAKALAGVFIFGAWAGRRWLQS